MRCMIPPGQRINLYRKPAGNVSSAWLHPKLIVAVAGTVVMATLLTWAWFAWQGWQMKERLYALQMEIEQKEQELEEMHAENSEPNPDAQLAAQGEALEKRANTLQRLLQRVERESQSDRHVYSTLLKGLARLPLDGLWIERLRIEGDPARLSMGGKALRAEAVPMLLQTLKNDPVFHGIRFQQARLHRVEDASGLLEFDLGGEQSMERGTDTKVAVHD